MVVAQRAAVKQGPAITASLFHRCTARPLGLDDPGVFHAVKMLVANALHFRDAAELSATDIPGSSARSFGQLYGARPWLPETSTQQSPAARKEHCGVPEPLVRTARARRPAGRETAPARAVFTANRNRTAIPPRYPALSQGKGV